MAAPPTRPRLRARYEQRHQEVVDSAARLFADRGYHATTMADLIAATGLTSGGLYHYIGSKERLLLSILDGLIEPLLEELEPIVEGDEAPAAKLRQAVAAWLAHVERHEAHMKVFLQERLALAGGPHWDQVRATRKRFEALLDRILEEVEAAGALAVGDRTIARYGLLGMVNWTTQWFDPRGRLTTAELAEGYCDLVLRRPARRRRPGP